MYILRIAAVSHSLGALTFSALPHPFVNHPRKMRPGGDQINDGSDNQIYSDDRIGLGKVDTDHVRLLSDPDAGLSAEERARVV